VKFLDLVQQLIADIDFSKCKVIRPENLMFLCGGEQGAGKTPLPSVREALLRHLPNREKFGESRILLAEQAVDAFADTAFENLLDLEECIAAIVTSVVLIVESAGSICELERVL
jgi:hypothetical protein